MVANFPNGGTVTNGLVQCNRLIVEDCGLTNAYMKRVIRNRVANGQHIAEIWVSGQNATIYIKSEGVSKVPFWHTLIFHVTMCFDF